MQITRTFDAHYVINHLHGISIWNAMLVIEWLWPVRSVGKYFVIRRVTLSIWKIFIPCLWTRSVHQKFCYLLYNSSNKTFNHFNYCEAFIRCIPWFISRTWGKWKLLYCFLSVMKRTTCFPNFALFLKVLLQCSQCILILKKLLVWIS